MTTWSPVSDGLAAELEVRRRRAPHVRQRRLPADGLRDHRGDQRRVGAQLGVLVRDTCSARRREPEMVLRVVSLPPMISRMTFPRYSNWSMSARRRAVRQHRDQVARGLGVHPLVPQVQEVGRSTRSSRRASAPSCRRCRGPAGVMTMSDQRVSLRRSSNGKSNSVASVIAVSSIETLSTQSNGFADRQGVEDRGRPARGSAAPCCAGWPARRAGLTVLRCTSCLGGSMAMNMRGPPPCPGPPNGLPSFAWSAAFGRHPSTTAWLGGRVMPPSDENTWWLVSTAMMSLYWVIDQCGRDVALGREVHRVLGPQPLEVGPMRVGLEQRGLGRVQRLERRGVGGLARALQVNRSVAHPGRSTKRLVAEISG